MGMFKMKNNFLFIILISIVTLVVLVVGAFTLYKDSSYSFSNDGYIIETTTESNTKYYFSANTKYKENVDEMITFNDVDDEKVVIDPASFVHYSNGDVTYKGKVIITQDGKTINDESSGDSYLWMKIYFAANGSKPRKGCDEYDYENNGIYGLDCYIDTPEDVYKSQIES